MPTRNKSTIN